MCARTPVCSHVHPHTCIHTHVCAHEPVFTCVHTHNCDMCACVPVPVCTGLPTCVWISVPVHMCVCMSTSVLKLCSCVHVCERASSHLSPHEDKGRVKAG